MEDYYKLIDCETIDIVNRDINGNCYDIICDELWYIYADEETRRERLKLSRGYSDEKIDSVFASQLSDEQFRSHCSRVIDNSHDEQMTLGQLKEIIGYYD